MAVSKANVIVAKPKVTGGISVAPLGTTLPTDPSAELPAAFNAVGYITSDGVTRSQDRGADTIAAWGGSTIAVIYGEQSATVQFSVAEYLNEAALALVYGDANVKVTAATTTKGKKIDIAGDLSSAPHRVVALQVFSGDAKGLIVFPDFVATEVGDTTFVDSDLAAHDITGTLLADANGKYWYEHWDDGQVAAA